MLLLIHSISQLSIMLLLTHSSPYHATHSQTYCTSHYIHFLFPYHHTHTLTPIIHTTTTHSLTHHPGFRWRQAVRGEWVWWGRLEWPGQGWCSWRPKCDPAFLPPVACSCPRCSCGAPEGREKQREVTAEVCGGWREVEEGETEEKRNGDWNLSGWRVVLKMKYVVYQ